MIVRTIPCPYVHPDGHIDYHDPITGNWIQHAKSIPDHAMNALPDDVQRHTRRRLAQNSPRNA